MGKDSIRSRTPITWHGCGWRAQAWSSLGGEFEAGGVGAGRGVGEEEAGERRELRVALGWGDGLKR